jgi:hypothetical protein
MDTEFSLFGDSTSTMLTLMVFLATAVLSFAVMAMIRVHGAVKRRTAGINAKLAAHADFSSMQPKSARFKAADRIINYAQKYYGESDTKDMKVLRRRLMLAGIYNPRGVAFFFIARSIVPAFPISWTCWWSAPMRACRWKRRSTGLGGNWPILIRRCAPISTWPIWKSAPVAP